MKTFNLTAVYEGKTGHPYALAKPIGGLPLFRAPHNEVKSFLIKACYELFLAAKGC